MTNTSNLGVLARATLVIGSLMAIVGGVTFSALQSQAAVVKGNSIQTAVASLQVSSDGSNYTNSLNGYAFDGLIPGGAYVPTNGYPVYLKNVGTTPLSIKISVLPSLTNTNQVDLSKVRVSILPLGGGAGQNFSLQELVNANSTGGIALTQGARITSGQTTAVTIKVSMEADAITGPSANISNLDINFDAVAVN